MRYRAIVFDYDGTIIDTERVIFTCWQEVFREHGLDLPLSDWAHVVGAASDAADPYAMLARRLGRDVDRHAVERRRRPREMELLAAEPPRPGVASLLREAKQAGLKIGLASNSPLAWVIRGLDAAGLAGLFDTVCTPDDGALPKPDPALYRLAVQRLGVAPSQAIAIEDSPHGANAALGAGLCCVVVPGELTRDQVFPPGAIRLETLEGLDVAGLVARCASNRAKGDGS